MRIDVHAHYWTEEFLDLLIDLGKADAGQARGIGAGGGADLEARLRLMDRAGIQMQVLSAYPQSPYGEDADQATKAARFVLAQSGQNLLGVPGLAQPHRRLQSCRYAHRPAPRPASRRPGTPLAAPAGGLGPAPGRREHSAGSSRRQAPPGCAGRARRAPVTALLHRAVPG
jgi:hypothetical protein